MVEIRLCLYVPCIFENSRVIEFARDFVSSGSCRQRAIFTTTDTLNQLGKASRTSTLLQWLGRFDRIQADLEEDRDPLLSFMPRRQMSALQPFWAAKYAGNIRSSLLADKRPNRSLPTLANQLAMHVCYESALERNCSRSASSISPKLYKCSTNAEWPSSKALAASLVLSLPYSRKTSRVAIREAKNIAAKAFARFSVRGAVHGPLT